MIKGIIFDVDGVIVDSCYCDFKAWEKIFKEIGDRLTREIFTEFQGMKGEVIIQKYSKKQLSKEQIKDLANKKDQYYIEVANTQGLKEIPGVATFLSKLKKWGYVVGLGTAGTQEKTMFILKTLKIEKYFDVYVTADEIINGKPDPETFLKGVSKLGLQPSECLVIEDSKSGIKAAKAGGMKCIAITSTHDKSELEEADLVVDSFDEITLEVIKNL